MRGTSRFVQPSRESSPAGGAFQSTLWSQVRAAALTEGSAASPALESLCRAYWNPIYAFLRRSGYECDNAKDLTQDFFLYVLQEGLLQKADQDRGRFRSFLLGALKFFVSNERARAGALKRGGRATFVTIDTEASMEPALLMPLTPERMFERKWALTVIGQALERLETEYRRAGLDSEFGSLSPYLTGEPEDHLSDLAVRLGKSHSATRVMMFRIRNRFRRMIRAVITDTLADPSEVERELAELQRALRAE